MAPGAQPVAVLLVGQSASPVGRSIARGLAGRPVRVLEAPNVYEAVVLLAQRPGAVGLAFVDVDGLTDAEMKVFGFVHRRFSAVPVVAYGQAGSGRRLAAAAAAGAVSVIAGAVINGQLDDLLPSPAESATRRAGGAPALAKPPVGPAAAANTQDILTEAEMDALLGDGSDAPAVGREAAEPKPAGDRPAASRKASHPRQKRKRKSGGRKKP